MKDISLLTFAKIRIVLFLSRKRTKTRETYYFLFLLARSVFFFLMSLLICKNISWLLKLSRDNLNYTWAAKRPASIIEII